MSDVHVNVSNNGKASVRVSRQLGRDFKSYPNPRPAGTPIPCNHLLVWFFDERNGLFR